MKKTLSFTNFLWYARIMRFTIYKVLKKQGYFSNK